MVKKAPSKFQVVVKARKLSIFNGIVDRGRTHFLREPIIQRKDGVFSLEDGNFLFLSSDPRQAMATSRHTSWLVYKPTNKWLAVCVDGRTLLLV